LAEIVDQGTVEYCSPEEFCRISDDHEHVFKGLLRQCLQQKVVAKGIKWQHKEKLFIFVDRNGEDTREERWEGIDSPSRKVYERTMKKDKPEEILNCKHLAFTTEFRRYGNRWLLLVKPEWFFSFDGFHRNR
jgi:hypothetical protein